MRAVCLFLASLAWMAPANSVSAEPDGRLNVLFLISDDFFGYSLRTPRWRYTEWAEGDHGRQLYDHDADPLEQVNLANAPEHAPIVAELSSKLREAVARSYPPSGETPPLSEGLWTPNVTDP